MRETSRLRFDANEHFKQRAPIIIAEKCSTAAGAERAIETAVRKHGVKIVAVDYAQLLKGTGDNEQERIGDVSQRMKDMAMKHDLIVLLLAQLNRGIESRDDRTPTLGDLRGSGSLEQDADVVLFPVWPWKFDAGYPQVREYRIYQEKNRSRGRKELLTIMRINPERQRLEEIANPYPRQSQNRNEEGNQW
jgi:replicative DNA helicase